MSIFLDHDDVARLTGKHRKSDQVKQLRLMGLRFYVNALGEPVVPLDSIGINNLHPDPINKVWAPNVLKHG